MNALPLILALTTFFSTMAGGLFALKNQDRLHRILGFTAGILLGVVAFDLLPEIMNLVQSTGTKPIVTMISLTIGFLFFHSLEKLTQIHHHEHESNNQRQPSIGVISASALSAHSFFDGVGIGLAFQVNTTVGLAVAAAVIAHDFADGLNTVTLMLVNKNSGKRSFGLLLVDAIAPVLGAASTLFFHLSDKSLLIYLGFFVGFLLYIGASDILPEAHADHPSKLTLLLTILGTAFIFVVTRVSL
jgi:zinc transporter ZupT